MAGYVLGLRTDSGSEVGHQGPGAAKQAGLFSGEGGTGKSIIELMKDVAHVTAKDWLGTLPEPGPAFYLGAEDDDKEIHIRLAGIAKHYGVTFSDLIRGGLHVLPLLGKDATLCAVTKGGKSRRQHCTSKSSRPPATSNRRTSRSIPCRALSRAMRSIEGRSTGSRCTCTTLAKVAEGAVTVLSHPSLQGLNSGSGLSGSTAWHGAFRFRQYLKGVKASDGEQPENDLRELEFKKNQYGPRGDNIVLRYQRGLFLPEGGVSSLDRAVRNAKAEEVFLDLLNRFSVQNRNVSDKPTANTYAPTMFAKEDAAKKLGLRKRTWSTPCGAFSTQTKSL